MKIMRYVVVQELQPPFFTEWMDEEKFPAGRPAVVIDLRNGIYTRDGLHYFDIEFDHL